MAGKKGRLGGWKLDDIAGSLTDLSRKGTKFSMNHSVDILDATTFQPTGGRKEKMTGLSDFKFSVEGNVDAALASHLIALVGQSEPSGGTEGEGFDYELSPEGTASGKRKITGKCFLAGYSEDTSADGINTFSAEFEGHGAPTVSTHS